MDGSEADAPTAVRAPGDADAPVVREDAGARQIAVGPDLGDGLLLARGPRGAVVADEDVAGRVERDAGDARKRHGRDHSRLERQDARPKRPAVAGYCAAGACAACEAMALKLLCSVFHGNNRDWRQVGDTSGVFSA